MTWLVLLANSVSLGLVPVDVVSVSLIPMILRLWFGHLVLLFSLPTPNLEPSSSILVVLLAGT